MFAHKGFMNTPYMSIFALKCPSIKKHSGICNSYLPFLVWEASCFAWSAHFTLNLQSLILTQRKMQKRFAVRSYYCEHLWNWGYFLGGELKCRTSPGLKQISITRSPCYCANSEVSLEAKNLITSTPAALKLHCLQSSVLCTSSETINRAICWKPKGRKCLSALL